MASPARRSNPYRSYERLRRLDRVHRSPIGVWLLSGHADANELLRDPRLSSSEDHVDLDTLRLGPLRRVLGRSDVVESGPFFEQALLLFMDPPDHTRIRTSVNRAFTPRRVHELEGRIRTIADELIDPIESAGRCELMSEFAYPFPARVICELVGVPDDEMHHLIEHAPALAGGLEPGPMLTAEALAAANAATVALSDYMRHLIDHRRANPDDRLLSALLTADDRLTDDELVALVLLLLIAGHETTANLLGNGMVALLNHPAQARELVADESLDVNAVDELLRYDSPVQLTMRVPTEPIELRGHRIPAGTVIVLCIGAANHDPDVFADPEHLDWHRPSNPHLAFGGGIHYCLGAQLARTEARIGLRALLDRVGLPCLDGAPVRRPSFTIRGLERLDLRWA